MKRTKPEVVVGPRRYFSVAAAATRLNIHPRRLYRLVEGNQVPHARLGARILIDLDQVQVHLSRGGGTCMPRRATRAPDSPTRTGRVTRADQSRRHG